MKNNILTLAKDLITIESTSTNPKGLAQVLDTAVKGLSGFTIEKFEHKGVPSLLVYPGKNRPASFKVILNAHLDVVPGRNDQYKPQVIGDKLIGRGAYDMKAAAAAEILAFKHVTRTLAYPVGLQLVTDEEIGGFNATKYQVEQGVKADFVVVGECASNFNLGLSNRGIAWITVATKGIAAHGAYPWKGKNAIAAMHEFLARLWKKYPVPDAQAWTTTVNVASVNTANKTHNKVPDECSVYLDIRYIAEDKDTILDSIKKLLPEDAKLEVTTFEPSHETKPTDPYIRSLAASIKNVTGKTPEEYKVFGGSDLRHFAHTAGVEFGPIGSGHHTDDEWVSIDSLVTYYNILEHFLKTVLSF